MHGGIDRGNAARRRRIGRIEKPRNGKNLVQKAESDILIRVFGYKQTVHLLDYACSSAGAGPRKRSCHGYKQYDHLKRDQYQRKQSREKKDDLVHISFVDNQIVRSQRNHMPYTITSDVSGICKRMPGRYQPEIVINDRDKIGDTAETVLVELLYSRHNAWK